MITDFSITGFDPSPEHFLTRCTNLKEADKVLNFFLKTGRITEADKSRLMEDFGNKKYEYRNSYTSEPLSIKHIASQNLLDKIRKFEANLNETPNDEIFEEINDELYRLLGFGEKIHELDAKSNLGYDITDYGGVLGRIKAIEAAELKDNEIVVDCGCFKGFLSLTVALLSRKTEKELQIIGVDLFADNVAACERNALLFDLDNTSFYTADLREINLKRNVDAQIFYRSLREYDIKQPLSLDFYGTNYKRVLDNTLNRLAMNGRIIIYDTEERLIELSRDYLEKLSFDCETIALHGGFLLRARSE